ncbi:hypothetical protein TSAR_009582 [Trichomalopsis sarcophagae]|uniref:Uncharacterized protein n=1 Tax=Trichomalopsis sarcophagae TaxID=543379 RepID=A0A232FFL7_9HYME|nr:hypothetical protein TSAR_009582 [Trichomalopsis sarcophagae]
MFHFNITHFIYFVFALTICANLVSKTQQGNVVSTKTTERNEPASDDRPSICKTNPCFSREVAVRCRKHNCHFPWEDHFNNNLNFNNYGKK